jgi:uncharacterized Zn-binding protein involved in type VI secretion
MRRPAAKKGDQITAVDTHVVMVEQVPTPLPHPFAGIINGGLSGDVNIMGMPAATVDSTADNTPPHVATPPGTSFQNPPSNKATIKTGSPVVRINGKMAARAGDTAETCNDPSDLSVGIVVAKGTVLIG